MNPTLQVPDVLHIEPCTRGRVRKGDVIVFADPDGRGNIVHRVIALGEDGRIRTQGDNNPEVDAYVLDPSDILGRVAFSTRNGKRRSVHGGTRGRLAGASTRLFRAIRLRLFSLLRPLYLACAGSFAFPWVVKRMNIRVAHYHRQGSPPELHLLMGSRCIGRMRSDQTGWQIEAPFKLFVDEKSLPRRDYPN